MVPSFVMKIMYPQFHRNIYIICLLAGVMIASQVVFSHVEAAVAPFVNYQSRLRDASGVAIVASTTIQFSIYNNVSTGSPSDSESSSGPLLWKETYNQSSGIMIVFCCWDIISLIAFSCLFFSQESSFDTPIQ